MADHGARILAAFEGGQVAEYSVGEGRPALSHVFTAAEPSSALCLAARSSVAEAPWSVAGWDVALRFGNPRATVLVLLLG